MIGKRIRFIGYCSAVVLIAVLTVVMSSCSKLTISVAPASNLVPMTIRTLSSIAVTPDYTDHFIPGSTHQFVAMETFSNGSTADITSQVTWISSDPSIAAIYPSGLATFVAAGHANITAAFSGVSSPAVTLRVWAPAPVLSSITVVAPSTAQSMVGSTRQFIATGIYSDGSTADITFGVTWISSDTTIAAISSLGTTTCIAAGNTNITAAFSGITSPPVNFTVSAAVA